VSSARRRTHAGAGRALSLVTAAHVAALLTAAAVLSDAAPAQESIPLGEQIESSSHELDALRRQIAEHRGELDRLRDEEATANHELAELTQEVGLVKTLLAGLATREEMLERQSDSLEVRLDEYSLRYAARERSLARRLRSLYKRGDSARWQKILTAASFSDLVTQLRYQTLVARLDSRLVSDIREQSAQIEAAQHHLRAALTGIWEAREEASRERERLELAEDERRALLQQIQRDSRATATDLEHLRAREQQLSDLLSTLEDQRKRQDTGGSAASDFELLAGALDWPVRGAVVRRFGRSVHPEYGTVTVNNGVTIATGTGAPVYAVAAGEVVFADDLPGFGVCVILDHGGGYYTLYANLGRVFAGRGEALARGEIVAEVASLPGEEGAELYFEIRRGKTPLDPAGWLRSKP
jgi:septal ring factor EnvC (AmiA/AmiB activator)